MTKDGSFNCEVRIIGKTPIDNTRRILFSPSLFDTSVIKRMNT
jgi:hypothetical protein